MGIDTENGTKVDVALDHEKRIKSLEELKSRLTLVAWAFGIWVLG
jgi:hypothetical protein